MKKSKKGVLSFWTMSTVFISWAFRALRIFRFSISVNVQAFEKYLKVHLYIATFCNPYLVDLCAG